MNSPHPSSRSGGSPHCLRPLNYSDPQSKSANTNTTNRRTVYESRNYKTYTQSPGLNVQRNRLHQTGRPNLLPAKWDWGFRGVSDLTLWRLICEFGLVVFSVAWVMDVDLLAALLNTTVTWYIWTAPLKKCLVSDHSINWWTHEGSFEKKYCIDSSLTPDFWRPVTISTEVGTSRIIAMFTLERRGVFTLVRWKHKTGFHFTAR